MEALRTFVQGCGFLTYEEIHQHKEVGKTSRKRHLPFSGKGVIVTHRSWANEVGFHMCVVTRTGVEEI